ncbi:MAG: DUF2147 domain-containing protein [Pararhodobacter sp.]|nr:DUF2147 domain-containing protein [Pararhodobacter sp.]
MRTNLHVGLIAVVAGLALALPAMADPVLGHWRTAPDDNNNTGIVEIAPCDDRICGTLIEAYDGEGQPMSSPNVGRLIVWDMEPRGGGRYRSGRVWAPDRDQTYSARMELSGDRLSVSGCVLVFCREAIWTRAN